MKAEGKRNASVLGGLKRRSRPAGAPLASKTEALLGRDGLFDKAPGFCSDGVGWKRRFALRKNDAVKIRGGGGFIPPMGGA